MLGVVVFRGMKHDGFVCDAVPGAKPRQIVDADAMMTINDDGSITIPIDVEVIELDGDLWFRTPRLRGWGSIGAQSWTVAVDGTERYVRDEIRKTLAETDREITHWTRADADAARTRELER